VVQASTEEAKAEEKDSESALAQSLVIESDIEAKGA